MKKIDYNIYINGTIKKIENYYQIICTNENQKINFIKQNYKNIK